MIIRRTVPRVLGVMLLAAAGLAATSGPVHSAAVPLTPYLADTADPAVTSLAAEAGISVAEARNRIGWQVPAAELDEALRSTMDESFGGLWIDRSDGGRIKVGVTKTPAAPALASAITARRLDAVTDLVPVRHSYARQSGTGLLISVRGPVPATDGAVTVRRASLERRPVATDSV
jgi:hypothetical protein